MDVCLTGIFTFILVVLDVSCDDGCRGGVVCFNGVGGALDMFWWNR